MSPLKVPGSDGFTAGSCQNNWDVVGEEVSQYVLDFLNMGSMNKNLNFTYIALIPKGNNPCCVSNY
jgi:hypothetical protein